jgi:hypothetical protein
MVDAQTTPRLFQLKGMPAVVQAIFHHLTPQGGSADAKQGGGTSHLIMACMQGSTIVHCPVKLYGKTILVKPGQGH